MREGFLEEILFLADSSWKNRSQLGKDVSREKERHLQESGDKRLHVAQTGKGDDTMDER